MCLDWMPQRIRDGMKHSFVRPILAISAMVALWSDRRPPRWSWRGSSRRGAAGGGRAARTPPRQPPLLPVAGRPTILITSAEHYGAVMNLDFDYRQYLDTLAADGMNYTRVFSGAYVEPDGAFNIARNTLAPGGGPVHLPVGAQQPAGLRERRQQVRSRPMGRRLLRAAEGLHRARGEQESRRRADAVLPDVRGACSGSSAR